MSANCIKKRWRTLFVCLLYLFISSSSSSSSSGEEENLKGKIENRLGKKERTNYCSTVSKKVTTVQPERRTQDVLLSSTNERTLYKVCKCVTLQIDLATWSYRQERKKNFFLFFQKKEHTVLKWRNEETFNKTTIINNNQWELIYIHTYKLYISCYCSNLNGSLIGRVQGEEKNNSCVFFVLNL